MTQPVDRPTSLAPLPVVLGKGATAFWMGEVSFDDHLTLALHNIEREGLTLFQDVRIDCPAVTSVGPASNQTARGVDQHAARIDAPDRHLTPPQRPTEAQLGAPVIEPPGNVSDAASLVEHLRRIETNAPESSVRARAANSSRAARSAIGVHAAPVAERSRNAPHVEPPTAEPPRSRAHAQAPSQLSDESPLSLRVVDGGSALHIQGVWPFGSPEEVTRFRLLAVALATEFGFSKPNIRIQDALKRGPDTPKGTSHG